MIVCVLFFSVLSSPLFVISYLLVTTGGQLGWLRLFWQPSTLYLSHMFIHICIVCTCNVKNKIVFFFSFFFFLDLISVRLALDVSCSLIVKWLHAYLT